MMRYANFVRLAETALTFGFTNRKAADHDPADRDNAGSGESREPMTKTGRSEP
jgi:hypothetical protein